MKTSGNYMRLMEKGCTNMASDFKKVFEADPHLASVSIRWERGLENIAQTMIRCDECGGHGYVPQVTSHEVQDPMFDAPHTVELASCEVCKGEGMHISTSRWEEDDD